MDNASLRSMVLEKVTRWKHLPLSDVMAMLPPVDRPRLRLELLEGMAADGLIVLRQIGDELVVSLVASDGTPSERTALPESETA
jgi:hypothetical protein